MRERVRRLRASFVTLTPERLALVVALGLALGIFPMYGCPTFLCALAAVALRLNFPALQVVNQLASPLQLALLVPLNRVGARIFHVQAASPAADPWSLAGAARDAVVGWACVCVPVSMALYVILLFTLPRLKGKWFNGQENPVA